MRATWWSRKALALHATVVVVAPGCLAAGWWMLSRATHGDSLAWIYTVEWPFFAGYAVYMWWKLLHDDPVVRRAAMSAAPASPAAARPAKAGREEQDGAAPLAFDPYDESDPELAAYNRYLASLHVRDRRQG